MPDLTTGQTNVLGYICDGHNTIRGLSAKIGTAKANISRYVDALVDAACVRRKPDPDDGRSVLVVATAKGRRVRGKAA